MKARILFSLIIIAVLLPAGMATAIPNMSQYTATPVFVTQSVPPNIMIILDNSGSMNYNAYGSFPGNGGTVNDEPYEGSPYSGARTFTIYSSADDMEQRFTDAVTYDNGGGDLDLGEFIVGLRFQNVDIPQGSVIQSASIGFIAQSNGYDASTLLVDAEASDDAPPLQATTNNIVGGPRTGTAASITWSPTGWDSGDPYSTDDISTIVQEIVARPGWQAGNAMLFRFYTSGGTATGRRGAQPRENGSGTAPVLRITVNDPGTNRYYGYFNPDYFYEYDSSAKVFRCIYKKLSYSTGAGSWSVETLSGSTTTLTNAQIATGSSSTGLWDGNWLNWLCMRRIDILRKVLFGGDTLNHRDGSGKQTLYGEVDGSYWFKNFDDTVSAVSPYSGNRSYRVYNGYITVAGVNFYIRVEKDMAYEPNDFFNYDNGDNLSGVVQKIWDMAHWGNIWFRTGTGTGYNGGYLDNAIGADRVELVKDLEAKDPSTWTPLAETFYTAMQYFRQEYPDGSLGYYSAAVPNNTKGDSDDPYYRNNGPVPCAKSYVILLTDGASTKDAMIPSEYKSTDGDSNDAINCNESTGSNCGSVYSDGGTDFLDDVAFFAHTHDLRADLPDDQTITLYTIYAFGNDPNARNLLKDAAKNGGFKDKNDNKEPDQDIEWDENGDGIPDTYYEAGSGYDLEAKLLAAFGDIGKEAASGTSASVLATNSEGEGHMLQAYFRSVVPSADGLVEAKWLGYLQSLWVDGNGFLREDTNQNSKLDEDDDLIVQFEVGEYGNTYVMRDGQQINLDQLNPIFESGKLLMQRDLVVKPRKIFTYIDTDQDGIVDESSIDMFDATGEAIAFDSTTAAMIKPYLGVADDAAYGTGGMELGATHDERVANLITWVRGTDVSGLRNRTIDGQTWRLGDIINSTPVTVAQPVENYHILYSDGSYREYWQAFKERETMIYVGSNDGMLHAFTSWNYDLENTQYNKPTGAPAEEKIGDEVWAFIPQAVLPHLKWPAHADYTHTYLVDGRPRVFDAKILPADTHYNSTGSGDSWGTFLVMGLNMGARQIETTEDWDGDPATLEDREFFPTYFCLDVTDPRNPRLMWERSYPDLAMSRSRPAPLKVGDSWYLVFGSGPTDYEGTSNQSAYLYIADLKTGQMLQRFGPLGTNAFFNDPTTFDKGYNYNVDAIYASGSNYNGTSWDGAIFKIAIPCSNCEWDSSYDPANDFGYDEDPGKWYLSQMFDINRPITAPVGISTEYSPEKDIDNVWVYFGTGRYITNDDILNADQQYLFGVKDPFFNARSGFKYDYANTKTVGLGDLFIADEITVTEAGHVLRGGALAYGGDGGFWRMEADVQDHFDGWYRSLETNGTDASERMISKPTLLGGMILAPAFTPDSNICSFGGVTNLYGLYYATGTGYIKQIFNIDNPTTILVNGNEEKVIEIKMPGVLIGTPPPAAGMHAGQERGAKAFLQQSTGQMAVVEVVPPFFFQSALIDWWEQ